MALEEQLALDAADALRTIDAIETALERAAASFKASLSDALDVLSSVAVGSVDASSVTSGIDAAVAAADLEPTIDADASGVTTAIDEAVGAATDEATIGADASGVTEAIDAAAADANPQVEVEADADAVTASIDTAVDEANTTVTIDAITDQIGAAIEDAVAGADATVEVDADTSQAEQQISELGSAAGEAGGNIDKSRLSLDALSTAAGASTGNLLGSERALQGLGGTGTAVAAGIGALTVSVGEFAKQALESDTADRRFASSLGEIRDRIAALHIDGFADDLGSLAEKTGNSDEKLKLAAARIADLGNNAGASQDEIAGAAENILLLATRVSVLNPTLGDAGDIADQLTNALARGGRPLAQFGLSLTAAQIAAEASARGLGDNAAELSIFEKAAIGADLVTKQLGTSLKTDIVEGAKGTEIQLRSLREQFNNALEDFGKPLLQPLLDAAREGTPILTDLAGVFGELAATLLPVLVDVLKAVAPALAGVADAVSVVLTVLHPILVVIDAIPDGVLKAIATFLALRTAFIGLQVAAVGLGVSFGTALGPLGLLATGISAAVAIFGALSGKQQEAKVKADDLTQAFLDQSKAIRADVEAAAEKVLADRNLADAVRRAGISVQEFSDLSSQGSAGLLEFINRLDQAGEVTPKLAAAMRLVAEDGRSLEDALNAVGGGFGDIEKSNIGLVRSFGQLQKAQQDAAEAAITRLVNDEKVTEQQVKQAEANTKNADGTKNYVAALSSLGGTLDEVTSSTEDAAGATSDLNTLYEDTQTAAKDANDALSEFTDGLFDYIRTQDSAQDAERSYEDALRNVTDREHDLIDARRDRNDATRDTISIERALNSVEDATAGVTEAERELTKAREGRGDKAKALTAAEKGLADAQKQVGEAAGEVGAAKDAESQARANDRLASAQDRLAEAQQRLNDAREEGGQEEDIRNATEKLERAQLDARDAALRLADAREQASTREQEAAKKVQQAERDLVDARNAAATAAVNVAQAQVDLATKLADLTGTPLLPSDRVRLFREELEKAADKASGPVKQAIIDVINTLNTLTGTPHAVQLTVDATQAQKNLDEFLKNLQTQLKTITFDPTFNRSAIFGGRPPGFMAGGTAIGPGSFIAGEAGRELITLAPAVSASVLPNRQTEALLSGSAVDPELISALRGLADAPRINASIVAPQGTQADPYAGAVETARQLQSLAVRLFATGG